MERRMRGNSHVRCEEGENLETTSKGYLSPYDEAVKGGSYAEGNAYEMFPAAINLHIADMLATYQKK